MSKDWLKDAATVDFETLQIRDRPLHPPPPVGVAIGLPGKKTRYFPWGHPDGNDPNAFGEARKLLGQIYESGRPILTHNGLKFDLEVGEVHMGLPPLTWDQVHDTLPLLFLRDPRAETYGLKPSAEALLGQAPDERDAVLDWLMQHQPIPGIKLSTAKKSDNYAGAYVAYAPPSIVGPYACGDVDRTRAITEKVWPEIVQREMMGAYDRERRLAPVLRRMEQEGIRIDVKRLERDVAMYLKQSAALESWLRKQLKAGPDLNLDSGQQLAKALIAAGFATEADLGVTKTGKMATNKDALTAAIREPQILACLKYRAQLSTCLGTFMQPWLEVAKADGHIYTTWHSTRTSHHEAGVGARTGRLSATPNLMNIPKQFAALFKGEDPSTKGLPEMPLQLSELPLIRSYVLPYEEGDCFIDRDYSQQEPRILAHYENGTLKDAYQQNPRIDFHTYAQEQLASMGVQLDRKRTKVVNLALIYGLGLKKLSVKIDRPLDETKKIKVALLKVYPGLRDLYDEMRRRAKKNEPIRTWGGREYYCEDPELIDGELRSFDYKLVNLLIQGSAADCTKEAMVRFADAAPQQWRLQFTVHDQLTASVPRPERDKAMTLLQEKMQSVEFDVQMLSEGSWSDKNWQDLEPYEGDS